MTTRGVTIVVHADGDLESKQYRLPRWAVLAGKWGAGLIAVLVVLFFAFAGPITRNALRVPGLEREVSRLKVENSRVQQFASALNRAEANYQELRQMLGVKAPPTPTSRAGGNVATNADFSGSMHQVPIRASSRVAHRSTKPAHRCRRIGTTGPSRVRHPGQVTPSVPDNRIRDRHRGADWDAHPRRWRRNITAAATIPITACSSSCGIRPAMSDVWSPSRLPRPK
jgi:hypothetical protein